MTTKNKAKPKKKTRKRLSSKQIAERKKKRQEQKEEHENKVRLFKKLIRSDRLIMTGSSHSIDDWQNDVRDCKSAFRYYYDGHFKLAEAISDTLLKKYDE